MKTRNIGCGIVREYGITEVTSLMNAGGPPWRVTVKGTYGRWASIVCETRKEALALGRLLSRRMNEPRKRKKRT